MKVDAKTLDELETKYKDEIASVEDPKVVFDPPWARGPLKEQIAKGQGPQAVLNLIADLRDARAVLEQVRLLKKKGATRETAKELGLLEEFLAHGSHHLYRLVWARADAVLGLPPEAP